MNMFFANDTIRGGGGGGGMVTDFSGTSILSNEFVVIGRVSTNNLGVLLGPRAQSGFTGGKATLSHLEPLWKNKIKRLAD